MKLNRSPGMILIVAGGFLMFIDTLLAWQSINVGGLTFSRNAWHGTLGLILGLLSIAFFANAILYSGIVESKVKLPYKTLAISLGPAILVIALIKNIDDSHSAWGAYMGVVLGALITWGAWMLWNEKPAPDSLPEPSSPAAAPPPATAPPPPEAPRKKG
jgi:hypothetical protein